MPHSILTKLFAQYFAIRPATQVRELFLSRAILDFASSAVLIFEPIYLYTIGFSLQRILLFYIAVYGLYFVIIPLGGKITRAKGYEHGIIYSTPFLVIYYLSLFGIPYSPIFTGTAIVSYALFKALFWPGYHADFARFGSGKGTQGRELGTLVFLVSASSILGPVVGGTILLFFGFPVLFVVVSVLILASTIPLLLTPEVFEPRELSYLDAWKRLFKKEHRPRLLCFMGFGEELIAQAVWPVFIFVMVREFFNVGAIVSAATMATAVMAVAIGRLTDTRGRHRMLGVGTFFTALSWFVRPAVASPLGVLGFDALYRSARNALGIPMIALHYEWARSYSVTKGALFLEMAVVAGKLSAAILCLIIVTFFDPGWTQMFILAGLYSLLYLAHLRA
ncbi:hypothetical protein A3D72_02880 [Candidatus Uhrbacteria bacterium RIFCSPHIGHO2_02_FULL_57_19]|uniref:Major facilitator superfamily (MFS) profile domain-containing protein n=1 Tax=Candidatus Uhrbacteria bacterium RIFCSPHIGHO2_02_FULL_57_19 TaxID=1802391 RepID=A0A1F7U5J1_9BACT|nr:MAG: hypothetical protein A3D72_02880 [Candidatus Uhrbacteria bacterium RIFCSPHIGHO2_02_FULL_57_19]